MTRKKLVAILASCLTLGLSAPAFADVKAGVDAWTAGDYDAAVAQWEGPAAEGNPDAMFNLGQAYRLGRGVEADVARARDLYRRAADAGHLRAADNYGLLLFQQGARAEAMPYIAKAAERGDPRAQYVLGLAHFNADQVDKDWVRAYALMTMANSSGLPQATGAIAQMDQYIPLEQRQEAQLLVARLKQQADAQRATQLASAALETNGREAAVPSAARPPQPVGSAPVAASTAAPAATIASSSAGADFSLPAGETPPAVQVASAPVAAAPEPAQTRPTPPPVTRPAATMNGPWKVQLGAFGVRANADKLWNKLAKRSELKGAQKVTVPTGRLTKLLAGGFASRSAAAAACSKLKASGQDCLVTR